MGFPVLEVPCDELARLGDAGADRLGHSELLGSLFQLVGHEDRGGVVAVVEVLVPADEFGGLRSCLRADDVDAYANVARTFSELLGNIDAAVEGVCARRTRVVDPAVYLPVGLERADLVAAEAHLPRAGLETQRRLHCHLLVLLLVPPALKGSVRVDGAGQALGCCHIFCVCVEAFRNCRVAELQ